MPEHRKTKTGRKKKTLLLHPCLAGFKFFPVDGNLSSEDALAVVDRDRVCDARLSNSVEISLGGAMRGSQLSDLVFLLTLFNCVYSFSTHIIRYRDKSFLPAGIYPFFYIIFYWISSAAN